MMLTDDELDRYQRHLLLPEVGGAGQQALKAASVLAIGAGGLGAPLLLYLAAAGVGRIGIVDDDIVDVSNLQRQVLYRTDDIGRPKAEVAAQRLAALNPHIAVDIHPVRLDDSNAAGLVDTYDLIADGSDNYATRAAVNRACVAAGRPLVSAAVGRFEGQLGVFKGHLSAEGLPCYACLFPRTPAREAPCAQTGILGVVTGILGTLQAAEVIKEILGIGESLAGALLLVDALAGTTRRVTLKADPVCPVCGPGARARP